MCSLDLLGVLGDHGVGWYLAPGAKLLISIIKSLMFFRTYSERQRFIIIAIKLESQPQWENAVTSINMKCVEGRRPMAFTVQAPSWRT